MRFQRPCRFGRSVHRHPETRVLIIFPNFSAEKKGKMRKMRVDRVATPTVATIIALRTDRVAWGE